MLVDTCDLVWQADNPKKGLKVHKKSVVLLMYNTQPTQEDHVWWPP